MKYCGGCNPSYDRVEYVNRVRNSAGSLIAWGSFEEGGLSALLVVNGCARACREKEFAGRASGLRVVSVKDPRRNPEEIVALLLGRP